jgi:4-hydroxy-tetrahydrodipicolinate synthase
MNDASTQRQAIQARQFPKGIPNLWCPTLTHFHSAHQPDALRIQSHLQSLSPYIRGILVPGSTGEGWEMSDSDILAVLSIVLEEAAKLDMRVLVGVLKTNVEAMIECLDAMHEIREHPAVAGFKICPPKGNELSQPEIIDGLSRVLSLGLPTALYQLPQITQNEMTPETVALLANEFPNFILFKDTSGRDRVALSHVELKGVFQVRGAEQGGYAAWTKPAGGPYDGFLLSTANVLARELSDMLRLQRQGNLEGAQSLSDQLVKLVAQAFDIVRDFPDGNAFANANKVLDHCMAYGERAWAVAPPLLYSGTRLPDEFIESGNDLLRDYLLLPKLGYVK